MFVFNMKLDGNRASKIFIGILCLIILFITCVVCYRLLFNNSFKTNDELRNNMNQVYEIDSKNYTNVLQNVHTNLDKYIGQKIKFSGYVYRLYDFSEEQFVVARNMIISSNFQSVVVGFLCTNPMIKNYEDNTWIEVQGTITKGEYNGEIPVIVIDEIRKIDTPSEEYVYPPDSSFVTTSTVL